MGKKTGGFLLGAFIGGTAAAVTALLLTPKTGKQLREDLSEQLDEWLDATSEYTELAKQKGSELTQAAKEKVQSFSEQASEAKEEVLQKLQMQKEMVAEELDDLSEETFDEWFPEEEVVIELDENYQNTDEKVSEAVEAIQDTQKKQDEKNK